MATPKINYLPDNTSVASDFLEQGISLTIKLQPVNNTELAITTIVSTLTTQYSSFSTISGDYTDATVGYPKLALTQINGKNLKPSYIAYDNESIGIVTDVQNKYNQDVINDVIDKTDI